MATRLHKKRTRERLTGDSCVQETIPSAEGTPRGRDSSATRTELPDSRAGASAPNSEKNII